MIITKLIRKLPPFRQRVHCWEDGPTDDNWTGSTCMLWDGHRGPHEFTPDNQIGISFPPADTNEAPR